MLKMKRLSAAILAIIVILSVCTPIHAVDSVVNKADSVLDAELCDILNDTAKDDRIPVDIWLYEVVSTEQLERDVSSKIGITKEQILSSNEKAISSEKVDEYIMAERTMYAEKNCQQYAELLKDYSSVKALTDTKSGQRLFFSQYAPLISAELTPAEIKLLAKDDRVLSSGNTEIVSFEPSEYGTYTIKVRLEASSTRIIYFGLAWW